MCEVILNHSLISGLLVRYEWKKQNIVISEDKQYLPNLDDANHTISVTAYLYYNNELCDAQSKTIQIKEAVAQRLIQLLEDGFIIRQQVSVLYFPELNNIIQLVKQMLQK